jgi:AcrR family transcriptional regulator
MGQRGVTPDPRDPDLPENRGGAGPVLPEGGPTTGRGSLDRDRILSAAVRFIDEHGLPELSMRRLGAHLGVEAMALYRYVPGRENLLDGVVELVIDELHGDPEVHLHGEYGWQDYLHRLAHGVRRIALAHPAVFPLVATRPPAAPWVRPPLRSLRWVESFLTVMKEAGFPDDSAVAAYRAYTSFLLGHLLLEVSHRGVPVTSEDEPDGPPPGDRPAVSSLEEFPLIRRLEFELRRDESAAEFEESLEYLVERLDAMLRSVQDR